MSPMQGILTFRLPLKYPFMQEPSAAGGRESAIIFTERASSAAPPEYSAIIFASANDTAENAVERVKENPIDSRIILETLRFPEPISSETNRLVEIKIFPLASTIIKLNMEVISVITPTDAVPSLFEIMTLSKSPRPCNINETIVSRMVSFAILFVKIFNVYPSFLSYIYENAEFSMSVIAILREIIYNINYTQNKYWR